MERTTELRNLGKLIEKGDWFLVFLRGFILPGFGFFLSFFIIPKYIECENISYQNIGRGIAYLSLGILIFIDWMSSIRDLNRKVGGTYDLIKRDMLLHPLISKKKQITIDRTIISFWTWQIIKEHLSQRESDLHISKYFLGKVKKLYDKDKPYSDSGHIKEWGNIKWQQ